MSQREPEPQGAEYFCLPVLLVCVAVGTGLLAGIWWLV